MNPPTARALERHLLDLQGQMTEAQEQSLAAEDEVARLRAEPNGAGP